MRGRLLLFSFLMAPAFLAAASLQASASEPKLESSDTMIPSGDPGIELFVRNKHLADHESSPDKILIFVHGATYPAETAFDLPIEGVSIATTPKRLRGDQSRRSATVSTTWSAPFLRISVARGRVGRMLSSRLARLVRSQIAIAVAVASSSDSSA